MPQFAANLSMMFTELPFMQRFAAAAEQGFAWVEYLFPYRHDPVHLAETLRMHGLAQALFNLPPGDWTSGERGLACIPGREREFIDGVEVAAGYAKALGCRKVHAMAGNRPPGAEEERLLDTYLLNIERAGRRLAEEGIDLCLEPISRFSMPEYFLRTPAQAVEIIDMLALPNLRLQFDFFHCQMEQGNVSDTLRRFFPYIGHCQLAGAPERHEPDQGELCYDYILDLLDSLGYDGPVGCEYIPAGDTVAGLSWIRRYGQSPARRTDRSPTA